MKPGQKICPLCQDAVDKLVYKFHYESERMVIERIRAEFPDWIKENGLCPRCLDFLHSEIVMEQRALPSIGPYLPIKTVDDFIVIPTGLRVNSDPGFTGRGVTICFIDSGFYPHPDLVARKNRIKKVLDITESSEDHFFEGDAANIDVLWHGTMTSVVCAGDGFLSKGLYKGIASDAELVLLKVQDHCGKITPGNIVKALKWILVNHMTYNIRIVNISLASDEDLSYKESEVDKLAEQLVEKGIVVVAAVGNDINATIRPPANSLNVITVGGFDDDNSIEGSSDKLYHSSYGKTIDGLAKPELIAHAIWIAAPILPESPAQKEAEALYRLVQTTDGELIAELKTISPAPGLDAETYESTDVDFIRKKILQRIRGSKFISPHYMHVDGTSFAAPIISAVVAQLLEINPLLTPAQVKEILFSTAGRIKDLPAERQGFGVVHPGKAILKTLKQGALSKSLSSPHINYQGNTIGFYVHNECASQISVAGSFNQWTRDVLFLESGKHGLWQLEIPMLPAGRYQYKFFVDEKFWVEDFNNPFREPDGFNGFNNILMVESN